MRVNVKLKGLEKMLDNIQDYEVSVQDDVKQTIKDTANKINASAKLLTPVDTGNLKRSISTDISSDEMSAKVFTDAEYAPHVEFGTNHASAQPFLFPAYESEMKEYMSKLEKALGGGK